MYSGLITLAAILVVYTSQDGSGQTTTTSSSSISATPTAAPPSSSSFEPAASQTINPTPASSSSMQAGGSASVDSSTSVAPTEAPRKTCGVISVVFNYAWNESFANSQSPAVKIMKLGIGLLIQQLYNDSSKYENVKVSNLTLKEKAGRVQLVFKLCMIIKNAAFIEDIFMNLVKTGRITGNLRVVKDSGEFEAYGVKFFDWKAKDGECKKCSQGGGGPFEIEAGKCKPEAGYSCAGLRTTEKSSDCVKYCDSSAAAIRIPSFILATLGIFLSYSCYIWK